MKARMIVLLLAAVAVLALPRGSESILFQATAVDFPVLPATYNRPPVAYAGRDFITHTGFPTKFAGYGAAPEADISKYEWDFDGDGTYDFESTRTGVTSYTYSSTGTYDAILKVYDTQGNVASDIVKAIVLPRAGEQEYLPAVIVQPGRVPSAMAQGDGVVERYAVMINGGYETRFWDDVTFMYSTLTNDYDFPPEHIYLYNYDGTNPDGMNPDNMIDYPAALSNIDAGFTELAAIMDDDDELFVWVTDHGRGYSGPQDQYYGYLDGFASVDPGDEQDYLERDFKLRSFCTYGDYYTNHGMNELKVCRRYSFTHDAYEMYRNKFVSTFTNLYFERSGIQSDNDIYIERLVDYLLGDTDRDGYVETNQGEVFDYDGDGNPPYDNETGTFDEDDWGDLDYYDDDVTHVNTGVLGDSYIIFDYNFDNHVDIDINYDPDNLEVDGTDLDNQGLFDGIDVNDDGDVNDWVSIDEKICLSSADMLDDEMAIFLDRMDANVISIFMEQCFSGGFIDDLSASNRVISTATEEETVSWGNLFVELFTSAFHRATRWGVPVDADHNHNGHISMMEAFNHAAGNDYYDEIPQYDDNGDSVSHPYPIPQSGDGNWGAITYLENFHDLTVKPATDAQAGGPGGVVTYTLQVTNTGNIPDTFDVAASGYTWLTNVPTSVGPLAADDGARLDVTIHIPTNAMGRATDTVIVIVTSQGDSTQSVTATLTTTANIVCGVETQAIIDTQVDHAGTIVTYTLQVTNTGNISDTFDMTVSGNVWPTTVPPPVQLSAGDSASVDATVYIPPNALDGEADIASITTISREDNSKWATVTLTTTAINYKLCLPLILR